MRKVLFTGTSTTRRPPGRVPAREIAFRCLCYGGLAAFVAIFWIGAVKLVQMIRLMLLTGLP